MSDYLSNLAARTLSSSEVIQPRLASRFEPLPTQGPVGRAQATNLAATDTELEFNAEGGVGPLPARTSRPSIPEPVIVPMPQFSRMAQSQRAEEQGESSLPAPRPQHTARQHEAGRSELLGAKPLVASNDDRPSATKIANARDDNDEAAGPGQPALRRPQFPRLGDFEMRPTPELPWAAQRPMDRAGEDDPRRSQFVRRQMVEAPLTRVESVHEVERIIETVGAAHSAEIDKREVHTNAEAVKPIRPAATDRALAQTQPLTRVLAQPGVTIAPMIRPAPVATQPVRNEASAAAPTILVTIGRIEVRATPSTTTPARKANATPVMSLDDYLRARNGGSR